MRQTEWVIERLRPILRDAQFTIVPVTTEGDRIQDLPLAEIGGKGLFVSEIEQALHDYRGDLAVHSLKDVPARLGPGLVLAGFPLRQDARDALVSSYGSVAELPLGATIGTSSLRRAAQLRAVRPDVQVVPLRGNIDTRLRKLESERLDAIVLAAAGLIRMGWSDKITELIDPQVCLPAIGQGLLGIECRADDTLLCDALQNLTENDARRAGETERTLLQDLDGGCQVPIAGYAEVVAGDELRLRALVADGNGQLLRADVTGSDPAELGHRAAGVLLRLGAGDVLAKARRES